MNADAFRHLYDYHFAQNRIVWELIAANRLQNGVFWHDLTYKALQPPYSVGSLRDQIVHLIEVEELWFDELRNVVPGEAFALAHNYEAAFIRDYWDGVEAGMRAYLDALTDDMLFTRPISEPDEDRDLQVWQVLLHVANHATDHRAQILRELYELGVETPAQDYIFFAYAQPFGGEGP